MEVGPLGYQENGSILVGLSPKDTWSRSILKAVPFHTARPFRIAFVTYYGLEGLGSLQLDSEDDFEEVRPNSAGHFDRQVKH